MAAPNTALAAQLAAMKEIAPQKGGGKFPARGAYKFKPGPEIKFVKKNGLFAWMMENAEGEPYQETAKAIRGVIMDYGFHFKDLRKTPGGPGKKDIYNVRCQTIGHTGLNADGEKVKGDGYWPIPAYDAAVIDKMFAPYGSQMDPELVDDEGEPIPLSCQRCRILNLHMEQPGEPYEKKVNETACKDEGYVTVLIYELKDPKKGAWAAPDDGPFLATFAWGKLSNDNFQYYQQKLAREYGLEPTQVATEFSLRPPDKNANYRPQLDPIYIEEGDTRIEDAKAIYGVALAEDEAARKAWGEEQKAARDANKPAGGATATAEKKPPAKVGGVKTQPKAAGTTASEGAPVEDDDDQVPF